jgi:hypothetical protein
MKSMWVAWLFVLSGQPSNSWRKRILSHLLCLGQSVQPFLDFKIPLKTFPVVLKGLGF